MEKEGENEIGHIIKIKNTILSSNPTERAGVKSITVLGLIHTFYKEKKESESNLYNNNNKINNSNSNSNYNKRTKYTKRGGERF